MIDRWFQFIGLRDSFTSNKASSTTSSARERLCLTAVNEQRFCRNSFWLRKFNSKEGVAKDRKSAHVWIFEYKSQVTLGLCHPDAEWDDASFRLWVDGSTTYFDGTPLVALRGTFVKKQQLPMSINFGYRTISHGISLPLSILDIANTNRQKVLPTVNKQWDIGLKPVGYRFVFRGIRLTLGSICLCLQWDMTRDYIGYC